MAPFRGRGGFRGRGRGGRFKSGGQKRGFAAAKVNEPGVDGQLEPLNTPEPDAESDLSSEDISSDEETQATSEVYQALLQSYQASEARQSKPPRKRRKLERPILEKVLYEEVEDGEKSSDEETGVVQVNNNHTATSRVSSTAGEQEEFDDLAESVDPFGVHFADPDENKLSSRLKAISKNEWTKSDLSRAGRGKCILQVPDVVQKIQKSSRVMNTEDIKLKPRLAERARITIGSFSELEQALVPSIFEYQDVLFGARTTQNADRFRHITCLHALNHIFKTRDRVIKNNARLAQATNGEDLECRDQGFTRPKVLFLLETKQACVRVVDSITNLCEFEQQENKKRFLDSFSISEEKFSDDRPDDFRELFEGNDENEFRIGLKFTRKTMKLYSKFYNSDIIFASALGLRRAIESGDSKKKDYDFLSSIEMVIMEQADATVMQNWEHAEYIFDHLNLQPRDAHDCDFSRVRSWYLDGHAANLRQTIVLSAYLTPKINALYNKHMKNAGGRLKYTPDYANGAIETLNYGIKQTFSRFESPNYVSDPDARFKYFSTSIVPQITRLPKPVEGGLGVLIFIPSYLDFVRVRNSLVDSDFSYASISEYTDATDVRKARSHFMTGRHSLLLYTARAHHFHRYNIRGVKRVVFYGIPENPLFFEEVVGFIGKTLQRGEASKVETNVRVCFSKWERMELERVVGSKRVGKMVADRGDTFDFV